MSFMSSAWTMAIRCLDAVSNNYQSNDKLGWEALGSSVALAFTYFVTATHSRFYPHGVSILGP